VRRSATLLGVVFAFLLGAPTAFGQRGCELNIVGTWAAGGGTNPTLYRFTGDGTVTALSISATHVSEQREIASATYLLDNPKAPKMILFKAVKERGEFPLGTTAVDITGYDDTSITLKVSGQETARWTRVDPHRYFMVLAGRIKTFYDGGGPTFPMLVKTDGRQSQIDAVGIYSKGNYWDFGTIPAETYNQFMREPHSDSEVMLRLEITAVQYERALKIVRTWERRVREQALLYPDLPLDNILLVRQITETLNQCGERIKLYKLDWSLEDHISSSPLDNPLLTRIPFMYFKELRRLNESLHVGDEKFHLAFRSTGGPQGP
jgi:hypothetical protein